MIPNSTIALDVSLISNRHSPSVAVQY